MEPNLSQYIQNQIRQAQQMESQIEQVANHKNINQRKQIYFPVSSLDTDRVLNSPHTDFVHGNCISWLACLIWFWMYWLRFGSITQFPPLYPLLP